MKPIEIPGKYGTDRLIIKVNKKNMRITAIIDNCGCEFVVPIKDLGIE